MNVLVERNCQPPKLLVVTNGPALACPVQLTPRLKLMQTQPLTVCFAVEELFPTKVLLLPTSVLNAIR